MAQSTTLSSLGTSSTPLTLNIVPKATTIQITVAAGASGSNIFAQYTLDDTVPVGGVQTWANLSSAIISSNADGGVGATYTMLSPIGGLRLSSTTAVTGTITLKSLQTVTG